MRSNVVTGVIRNEWRGARKGSGKRRKKAVKRWRDGVVTDGETERR